VHANVVSAGVVFWIVYADLDRTPILQQNEFMVAPFHYRSVLLFGCLRVCLLSLKSQTQAPKLQGSLLSSS